MKIAFASSEIFPYAKTGGLADVAGSLPIELKKLGHDVKVFMPKYNLIDEEKNGLEYQWDIGEMPIRIDGRVHQVHVHKSLLPDSEVEVYFIDCPFYFHRGQIYTENWDEDERFILFQKGVIEVIQRLKYQPDILHCNDWQTALIPLMLRDNYKWDRLFDNTATVFTIHNVAYQGRFSKEAFHKAEIEYKYFLDGGVSEYEGAVNFMKTAIYSADAINTVSENYARELLTPEYGEGMNAFLSLRKNDFFGILNGVDYAIWNPETDKHIPFHYNAEDLTGKKENKKYLLDKLNLPYNPKIPVIGIVSRMVSQKGFDIVADGIEDLVKLEAQWVILGSGEQKYQEMFTYLNKSLPGKFVSYIGYNNDLAHLIEAGTDIFLMPSKFEPCGLNQIYSLKYGTVPVVRKTGGLADTVLDWNEYLTQGLEIGTGYSFWDYNAPALVHSVQRAVNDFQLKEVWQKIQLNGMKQDYSWQKSAVKYIELYEHALKNRNKMPGTKS